MFRLGFAYLYGGWRLPHDVNNNQYKMWFRKAAEKGNSAGMAYNARFKHSVFWAKQALGK